ncbi:prolyl 3-hydroxylase 1 isoform X1 [Hypanus sabinus]|uniref:prolyl 3-hydroxylase 1 isoform X1 n=1 Tax=Hypanus sabinus TaxID=79690 RepID=UPI0028C4E7DD|nr:prolyl 3-hydroxylase 1 isoform X1 [Hypanus sabinus]
MPRSLAASLRSLSLCLFLCLPLPLLPGAQPSAAPDPLLQLPYDQLWADGLRSYEAGSWGEAARLMERSLLGRTALRRLRTACSGQCAPDPLGETVRDTEIPVPTPDPVGDLRPPELRDPLALPGDLPLPIQPRDRQAGGVREPLGALPSLPQMEFFGRQLRRAACLQRCLSTGLGRGDGSRHRVSAEVSAVFRQRVPYNYLQICYYKTGQLDKAVAAAQTFLEANPDHEEMLENLEMYRRMEGVTAEDFKDLEPQEYWECYRKGSALLEGGRYAESAGQLEAAVSHYLSALDHCRAQCEGPIHVQDRSSLKYPPHLHEAIADHFVQVLKCRQECVSELSNRRGPPRDLLPSAFDLLRYAYHRAGDYEQAVQCSRTFLLFRPADPTVRHDLDFYRSQLGAERADRLGSREEVRAHVERSLLEKQLLYRAVEELGATFQDPDSWTPPEIVPESVKAKHRAEAGDSRKSAPRNATTSRKREPRRGLDILKASSPSFASISLVTEGGEPDGSRLAQIDGVLSHADCVRLRRLANTAEELTQTQGDKPQRRGLAVLEAMKLSREGKVDQEEARLYMQVTERVSLILDHYFQPSGALYLSFTHLACHSSSQGSQTDVPPLSRDCLEDPESSGCSKQGSAEGARNFSVHLYLNEEFEGGEFILTEPKTRSIMAEVSPRCGRLLTFRWGDGTSHRVSQVRGGQRCVLSLWFSSVRKHRIKKLERAQAEILPVKAASVQRSDSPETGSLRNETQRRGRTARESSRRPVSRRDEL